MSRYTIQENDYNFVITTVVSKEKIILFKPSKFIKNMEQFIITNYNVNKYIIQPELTLGDATKLPKEWYNYVEAGDTMVELKFKKILKENI